MPNNPPNNNNNNKNNNNNNNNNVKKEEKKKEAAKNPPQAEPQLNYNVNNKLFTDKLKTFNTMYKTSIDADKYANDISNAWTLIKSGDANKRIDGKRAITRLFKATLKEAFIAEKDTAYNEYRLPDYTEIVKSANDLLRASMFVFTDMYHAPGNKNLFDETSLGGMNAADMADLTADKSLWNMDQRSDEAWEIQSREAKGITDMWLQENDPYDKMIKELEALRKEAKDHGSVNGRNTILRLAAAEWLLVNNEKMMIEDPDDPINPIPNWGNRYWKAIVDTREALGINKHTSMRDLIQNEYVSAAKAAKSRAYSEKQFSDHVLDPKVHAAFDSMEKQTEQFAMQNAALEFVDKENQKKVDNLVMSSDRINFPVPEQDESKLMKMAVKNYNNFIMEDAINIDIDKQRQKPQK